MKSLVIGRVGEQSTHRSWLPAHGRRAFDLFLLDYSSTPNDFAGDADYYERVPGYKYPALAGLLTDRPELLDRYDYFWMPDDDIVMDHDTLASFLELCASFGLRLAQPAIGGGSRGPGVCEKGVDYSHAVTLQDSRNLLRYTTFVEVMMPLFSAEALGSVLDTFPQSVSSFGLDFWWCVRLGFRGVGVVDRTPALHSRPIRGGTLYERLSRDGVTPMEELRALRRRFYRGRKPPLQTLLRVLPRSTPAEVKWRYRSSWLFFRLMEAASLRLPGRLTRQWRKSTR